MLPRLRASGAADARALADTLEDEHRRMEQLWARLREPLLVWREAPDGDVAVVAHVATQQQQSLDTMYSGPRYGGWGWGPGWYGGMGMGSATTRVRTYTVGTLVVDLFDTRTKQAIWRGTASDTVPDDPQKVDALVRAGIAEMFAGFPPGSAPPAK